mgnify:CR=1 FL=1
MNKAIFPLVLSFLLIFIVISVATVKPKPIITVPPIQVKKIIDPVITASSSIIVLHRGNESRVLYQKDAEREAPIASITKLFTAYVSTTTELFKPMLIESNNAAATKIGGSTSTIQRMNTFAKQIGLKKTVFFNPTGLDTPGPNLSTAADVAKAVYTMYTTEHGRDIFYISTMFTPKATNKALVDPRIPFKIVGGKTGDTDLAGQTLTLITSGPQNSHLVFVVLGSKDRFEDMVVLTNWAYNALYEKGN